ncbi:MAG: (2Fe-2S)-binding protein [Pseudobacteriovorax sp.]|nr:(2Fe-2S)-binding protein [Pseudobacteriovorax sp.]
MAKLKVNQKTVNIDVPTGTPILWTLREELKYTGPKFGCGRGLCGACTVLLNGQAIRSCVTPLVAAEGQSITTIEGASTVPKGAAVQEAWKQANVPQCGYCQPGQMMSAISLLQANANPSEKDIESAMSGNICRCGTYQRIKKAIQIAKNESK